jgi:uncharacterized protein
MPMVEMVVLQSTPFCNIDCKYCYLPDRTSKARMSFETIGQVFRRLCATGWLGKTLDVVWHAGEPLVLPVEYYAEAHRIIRALMPQSVTLNLCFQTNAMFIDDDWCSFFKEDGTKVGVSIDGPKSIHDANRVTRGGKSTFDESLEGIRCLRRHSIEFSVISVISAATLGHGKELHDFYVGEGITDVCFNMEEVEGINLATTLQFPGVEQQYEAFLREFWNESVAAGRLRSIREFKQMLRNIVASADKDIHNSLTTPFGLLNVDWQGNFSTFSPELLGQKSDRYGDFIFGNVHETSLEEAMVSPAFARMNAAVLAGVDLCRDSCEYFGVCGGGTPSNKFFENGSFASTETLQCRLHKKIVADLAMEIIENSGERDEEVRSPATRILPADLYILGAGVAFPDHLTGESLAAMRACRRIFANLDEQALALLPPDIAARCQSVRPLYRDQRPRVENYRNVTQAVIDAAGSGPIGWLTPGHPRVFDSVSEGLVTAARSRGLQVLVFPGISSIDTILAELSYDPAGGLMIHDATTVVMRGLAPVTGAALLLLQPGVFRIDIAHLAQPSRPDLTTLRDYLGQFYPQEHRCAFIRSPSRSTDRHAVTWTLLDRLCSVASEIVAGATLFLPPLQWDMQPREPQQAEDRSA